MSVAVRTPVDDPAAWRGYKIAHRDDWVITLDEIQLAELDPALDAVETQGIGALDIRQETFHFDARGQRPDGDRCQIIPIYSFERGAIPEESGMALEFYLEQGDTLIASNHVVLHERSAYTDHTSSGPPRHMLRLWLSIPNGRPLPEHYANTREFRYTYERRVAGRPDAG